MNEFKRQYDFDRTADEQIKRIRRSTCLEDLANELFYEIFDYLNGCDIHQAFSNLNNRFKNLLTCSSLPMTINLPVKSNSKVEQRCRDVILPNRDRILSLRLDEYTLIRTFFDHCTLDPSFTRLQSVTLNDIAAFKLMTILFDLNSLPRLSSLTIQLEEDGSFDLAEIYRLIFRLPSLKYSKVSVSICEDLDVFLPMSLNEKSSPIEHLVLNFVCTLKEMMSLLRHTPQLRRLTCERLTDNDEIYNKEQPLTLSNLTSITIDHCEIGFDEFEVLIKKISSALKSLRLKASLLSYLDAQRWKQLIKKHMRHLREFHFDCYIGGGSMQNITPDPEILIQFTSSFWTERKWFFEFKDTADAFTYVIHTTKKMWFEDSTYQYCAAQKYLSKSFYTSDRIINPSIQLTIGDYGTNTWNPSYIDDMKSCLTAVQFTHLNIDCEGIPLSTLIDIVHLLPNLRTLEIFNPPVVHSDGVSFKDSERLLLVSINNKTTNVKLTHMDSLEQIYFLFNLCPRMEYLEVKCFTETDLEKVIGCVSLNNHTSVLYLCHLCLWTPNANEKTVQTLHRIIDFERLFPTKTKTFDDYTIQHRQNRLFLTWKLP